MKRIIDLLLQKLKDPEFIKYFISGVSAYLIDTAVLALMTVVIFSGNDYLILGSLSSSKAVSSTVGITFSFILNRQWAFKATEGDVQKHAYRFVFVVIFNFIFAIALYTLMSQIALEIGLPQGVALTGSNLGTEGIKMITTYILYKFFVFKD